MLRLMSGAAVLLCVATAGAFSTGGTAQGAQSTLDASVVNRGVVELETGGSPDVSARIAEDIAGIVDDGATRRLVPVIGSIWLFHWPADGMPCQGRGSIALPHGFGIASLSVSPTNRAARR